MKKKDPYNGLRLVQTRIDHYLFMKLQRIARAEGIKNATWLRRLIMKELKTK